MADRYCLLEQQLQDSQRLVQLIKMELEGRKEHHSTDKVMNEVIQLLQSMSSRRLDSYKLQKALIGTTATPLSNIYSLGSDPLEDMSEYEPFTFPRKPSMED